jgi:hypothetical protein
MANNVPAYSDTCTENKWILPYTSFDIEENQLNEANKQEDKETNWNLVEKGRI